jgi:phosphatidylglycerol:prolipoprotein diacylglycerol transferase
MRPILFTFCGRPVRSYPVTLYFAIVLGIYAELLAARSTGADTGAALAATLIVVVIALLGARLLFVVPHWREFSREPRRILRFAEGGASMYGGVLLAVPLSAPVLALLGLPFGTYWDMTTFTMLVGLLVGRIGCFLNGCCAGRQTHRLGAWLPNERGEWKRRIPTQVLEAAWTAVVLAGAVALWGHQPFPGALLLYALGAYSAGRLVLETFREHQDRLAGFSLQHAISIFFVAVGFGSFAIAGWH